MKETGSKSLTVQMSPGVVGKKTNSRHRDLQLPKSERREGAWEKEKRKLSVKSHTASPGGARGVRWGRWRTKTMRAAVSLRESRGEVIPSDCFWCCLAFFFHLAVISWAKYYKHIMAIACLCNKRSGTFIKFVFLVIL